MNTINFKTKSLMKKFKKAVTDSEGIVKKIYKKIMK